MLGDVVLRTRVVPCRLCPMISIYLSIYLSIYIYISVSIFISIYICILPVQLLPRHAGRQASGDKDPRGGELGNRRARPGQRAQRAAAAAPPTHRPARGGWPDAPGKYAQHGRVQFRLMVRQGSSHYEFIGTRAGGYFVTVVICVRR